MAELYSGRFGGEADFVESLRWAIILEAIFPHKQGPDTMGELRDEILPKMSHEQIAEAERRAQAWLERHGG